MILAHLSKLKTQANLTPGLAKAIAYLEGLDPRNIQDETVLIDDRRVFAIQSHYTTLVPGEKLEMEGHRKYIDLQYLVEGVEQIAWADTAQVPLAQAYDENKDAWKGFAPPGSVTMLKLSAGMAALLYPEDAHCPQLALEAAQPVAKVVVKIAI